MSDLEERHLKGNVRPLRNVNERKTVVKLAMVIGQLQPRDRARPFRSDLDQREGGDA